MPSSAPSYSLSLHDALPIFSDFFTLCTSASSALRDCAISKRRWSSALFASASFTMRSISASDSPEFALIVILFSLPVALSFADRKSTRLNSSHLVISYAVFCPFLLSFPTRRSSDLQRLLHAVHQRVERVARLRHLEAAMVLGLVRLGVLHHAVDLGFRQSGVRLDRDLVLLARRLVLRRSEEHTSELQSPCNLVCRLLPLPTLFPYTTLFRSSATSSRCAPARRARCATAPSRSGDGPRPCSPRRPSPCGRSRLPTVRSSP